MRTATQLNNRLRQWIGASQGITRPARGEEGRAGKGRSSLHRRRSWRSWKTDCFYRLTSFAGILSRRRHRFDL